MAAQPAWKTMLVLFMACYTFFAWNMSPPAPVARDIVETLLRSDTPVRFQALGPSMNPTIQNGETVSIKPLANCTLHLGSIVLYKTCGRFALHRIAINKKRTNRLFMAGDAACTGGEWVDLENILGLAEWVCRDGKICRLDTPHSRWMGQLRFVMRPFRLTLLSLRQIVHAHLPARTDS